MPIEMLAKLSTKRGGTGGGFTIDHTVRLIAITLAMQLQIRITFNCTSYRSPR